MFRKEAKTIKKAVFGVVPAVLLGSAIAVPVLAEPQDNVGQKWTTSVIPGERDDSVHASQDSAGDTPNGQA